jgi:hypothetical protein
MGNWVLQREGFELGDVKGSHASRFGSAAAWWRRRSAPLDPLPHPVSSLLSSCISIPFSLSSRMKVHGRDACCAPGDHAQETATAGPVTGIRGRLADGPDSCARQDGPAGSRSWIGKSGASVVRDFFFLSNRYFHSSVAMVCNIDQL